MANINYTAILKKAWDITWHNKYLWWFGFFLALTSSGSFFNYSTNRGGVSEQVGRQISDFAANHAGAVAFAAIVGIIILVLLFVMRLLSRAALIESIEKKFKGESVRFGAGIRSAKKFFWRLFLLGFLIQLAVFAIVVLIATPIAFLFITKSYVLGTLLVIAGIIILLPLLVLAFFLENFGSIYAVAGNLPAIESIENAYALFRKNLGSSFVMALIFIPVGIVLGIGMLIAFFFLAIIFFIIGLMFFLVLKKIGAAIILSIAILVLLGIFLLIRSAYETFYQTVWILFFREIASPKAEEKIAETEIESVTEIKPETTPDAA